MGDFTINGTHNMIVESLLDIPKSQPFARLNGASVTKVTSGYGMFYFQQFKTSSYDIWLSEYRLQENATLLGTSGQPLIELQFILEQEIDYNMEGLGNIRMPGNTFNLNYSPYVENKAFVKKGSRFVTFDIHLSESDLQQMVSYCPSLNPFLEKVSQRRFASYSSRVHPITNEMIDSIYNTMRAPFAEELQTHYIESKIHTLLLLALGYADAVYPIVIKPTSYELECLENIKDDLLTNLDRPATIKALAKKYAINDCKLKKMFKDKYGNTLLGLVMKERINKATMLLKDTQTPIAEIAYMIGYKTANAFIDRFRRHFGMTPMNYRKRQ